MDPDERTILVTGGAGYIGAQTCKLLAEHGYTPVTFDNLGTGHRDAVRWGPLEVGDLTDPGRIDQVIARYRPRSVIHFAAFAYVDESIQDPGKYYKNNVGGTINLFEAMRRHHIDSIVFSSSCATYGVAQCNALTEDHPQNPINPYGWGKLFVERILADFDAAYRLRSVALRYFNAAGADPDGEIGENHDPETHLIPIILDVALGRRDCVEIFGDDYDTPDGTCIRDYIHVTDLADAHLRALEHLDSGGGSLRLNLGNGQGFSVREVLAAAERVIGRTIKSRMGPRREGDPPRLVSGCARAKESLGWNPRFGSLETILEHAWAWHQKRFGST